MSPGPSRAGAHPDHIAAESVVGSPLCCIDAGPPRYKAVRGLSRGQARLQAARTVFAVVTIQRRLSEIPTPGIGLQPRFRVNSVSSSRTSSGPHFFDVTRSPSWSAENTVSVGTRRYQLT